MNFLLDLNKSINYFNYVLNYTGILLILINSLKSKINGLSCNLSEYIINKVLIEGLFISIA